MSKTGDKKTVKIGDKKYPLQHPGVRWFIKHTDRSRDAQGRLNNKKYIVGMLDSVVIGNVKLDGFDNPEKKKTVTISGKEYTLLNKGVAWLFEHDHKCKDKRGILNQEKYIDGLLVEALEEDIKMDDFEDINDLLSLTKEIESFLGSSELEELVLEIESFLGANV